MSQPPKSSLTQGDSVLEILLDPVQNEELSQKAQPCELGTLPDLQTIKKWDAGQYLATLLDLVLFGVVIAFIVYAIAVKYLAGSRAEGSVYELLRQTSTLAPTIFPILFAAIVSRNLKAVAFWRLEKGAYVGHLDQMVGSTSITAAVISQFKLGAYNIFALLIILIWAFSPVGRQGSIRILGTTPSYSDRSTDLRVLNMSSDGTMVKYGSSDRQMFIQQSKVRFAAALSSSPVTRNASRDTWDNVKIPLLEQLHGSTSDSDGWIKADRTMSYASLIGVPISKVPDLTTFRFETSYWNLTCLELVSVKSYNCNFTSIGLESTASLGEQPLCFGYKSFGCGNEEPVSHPLVYASPDFDQASCTISNSFVEVQVECASGCAVSHVRRSQASHAPEGWIPADPTMNCESWVPGVAWLPNTISAYIVRPDDPWNWILFPTASSTLTKDQFAIPLSQLLNTFWSAVVGQRSIEPGPDRPSSRFDDYVSLQNVSGITQTRFEIMTCNDTWLILFLTSLVILLTASVLGFVATLLTKGPDTGLNVSSMLKDGPYMKHQRGNSAQGAGDRARLMKCVKVRHGDVFPGDESGGYVAIAEEEGKTFPAAFGRNRMYY